MRQIESVATANGAKRVVGVSVRVGALSNMSPAHMVEHFEQAAAGTIAAGAALSVESNTDLDDPAAQDIRLESVEIET
jgi:hydrogenase nickel incorporation protein HypA/HybF